MKRLLVLFFLLLFAVSFAFSVDFGLLLNQDIEAENELFSYTAGFIPWLSLEGSEDISVYLSGILSLKYDRYSNELAGNSEFKVIPELSLTYVNYRINQDMSIEAGRIWYNDVIGFTAAGLFDGARFNMEIPLGRISAELFYTGLLYKETAKILMTGSDAQKYADPDSYAASRRLLTSARWDIPLGESYTLSAGFLAQFDLNGEDEKLNSQYGAAVIELYPSSMMRVTGGMVLETKQNNYGDIGLAFGALAGMKMSLPTALNDWLGASVKLTTGSTGSAFAAFMPINAIPQGMVFPGSISGLAVIGADYSVRINKTMYAQSLLNYFIQTYDNPGTDGNMLGAELWASIIWQPFDDLRATLGAGAFFPGMGNSDLYGTDVLWKVSIGIKLSL